VELTLGEIGGWGRLIEPLVPAEGADEPQKPQLAVIRGEHAVPKVGIDVPLQKVLLHSMKGLQPHFQISMEPLRAIYVDAKPRGEPSAVRNAPVGVPMIPQIIIRGLGVREDRGASLLGGGGFESMCVFVFVCV